MEYGEFTDSSGLVYLAGAAPAAPGAQQSFAAEESQAPPAEEVIAVSGVEVRLLTDAEIQAILPAGVAVHVLPGNTMRLTVGGCPTRCGRRS